MVVEFRTPPFSLPPESSPPSRANQVPSTDNAPAQTLPLAHLSGQQILDQLLAIALEKKVPRVAGSEVDKEALRS